MSTIKPLALFSALLALVAIVGCSRPPELSFVLSEQTYELPVKHRDQIEKQLKDFFGTPVDPLLRIPDGEPEEGEELKLVDAISPDTLKHGAAVFNRRCAGCHGVTGDGNGEAAEFLQPKPRDYRNGVYKFTSTPYGAKPSRGAFPARRFPDRYCAKRRGSVPQAPARARSVCRGSPCRCRSESHSR